MHAFDNLSLVETLGAQRSTIESVQQFSPQPVVISPITLRPRFNPNATDRDTQETPESDPRQSTGFGAAWTLGTLARLAPSHGLHSLTFYETAGPRGVVDEQGRPYPMFHVFAALAGCDAVCETVSTRPLQVDALALMHPDGRRRVLLAGFTEESQTVIVQDVIGNVWVQQLLEGGFSDPQQLAATSGAVEVSVPAQSVVLLEMDGPQTRHSAIHDRGLA